MITPSALLQGLIFTSLCVLQEELRPYFSLPKVMDGLFTLVKMLFGIEIEPSDGLAPVFSIALSMLFMVL